MNEKRLEFTAGVLLALALLLLLSSITLARPNAGYDLAWWTVDGGGGGGSSGQYTLGGTIGQPDAGVWQGDGYTLTGGFWAGIAVERHLYLPLVAR